MTNQHFEPALEPSNRGRIFLLDNDRKFLSRVTKRLEREGFRVSAFTDTTPILQSLRRKEPDIAAFGSRLPRMDGMELLRKLRSQDVTIPILIFNESESSVEEEIALRLGADDFLPKPIEMRILIERIKACLRRARWTSEAEAEDNQIASVKAGPLEIDSKCYAVSWNEVPVPLTAKEFQVLVSLSRRPGHVKSRKQLMEEIYEDNVYVDERTVDSHIKRIRSKMKKADPEFAAIETLYGIGYRLNLPTT